MRKIILLCLCVVCGSGCTTWNTLKSDYLDGDDYDQHTFRDAWETLKTDHLHADEFDRHTL